MKTNFAFFHKQSIAVIANCSVLQAFLETENGNDFRKKSSEIIERRVNGAFGNRSHNGRVTGTDLLVALESSMEELLTKIREAREEQP